MIRSSCTITYIAIIFHKNLNLITIGETGIVSAVSCMNNSVKWLGGFQSDLKHGNILWIIFGSASESFQTLLFRRQNCWNWSCASAKLEHEPHKIDTKI